MKKPILLAILSIATLGFMSSVSADDQGNSQNKDPQRGGEPPKEAISICKAKAEDSSCSFKTSRGDMLEGTCVYTPDKKYFVCMPEGGPQMPPKRNDS